MTNTATKTTHLKAILILGVLSLHACASTPDVDINYYHPTTSVNAVLAQSFTCNQAKNIIFESTTFTTTPVNVADRNTAPATIKLKDFNKPFRDSNVTIGLYEDGRLQTINATITGRGQETIESIASVAGSFFGVGGVASFAAGSNKIESICKHINIADSTKSNAVLTLTYTGTYNADAIIAAARKTDTLTLEPTGPTSSNSAQIVKLVGSNLIKSTNIKVEKITYDTNKNPSINNSKGNKGFYDLVLIKPQRYKFTASVNLNGDFLVEGSKPDKTIPSPNVDIVKQSDDTKYTVPIPKGAFFGTNTFSLALNEAGGITSIGYNTTSGTSAALNTLNGGLESLERPSDTDIANAIAASARRARCEANPSECT